MPDLLDQLRGLTGAGLPDPEPVDQLRDRTARRRRRQRAGLVPVGVVVAIAAIALVAGRATDEPDRDVRTVDRPEVSTPTTTDEATTSTAVADEGTDDAVVTPRPTTVSSVPGTAGAGTGPLTLDELAGRPTSYVRLVYSDEGIVLLDLGPLPPRRVTDQSTRRAFLTYHAVVAQLGDAAGTTFGPIVVFDDKGQRELVPANTPQQGGVVQLHDLGYLDGRQVAVVSRSSGANRETWEERLFLVDILSGERHDLGEVGGWEVGVAHALLTDRGVIVLVGLLEGHELELRNLDGSTAWQVDDFAGEGVRSMVALGTEPSEIDVLEPSFDPAGRPRLVVRRFEPWTGEELEPMDLTLSVDPSIEITSGFCGYAEKAADLLCDQSDGPPLDIALPYGAGPGSAHVTLPTDSPDRGTTTLFRYDV